MPRQFEPVVGMLATYDNGRDTWAGRIIRISPSKKTIEFKGETGMVRTATLRRDGTYRPTSNPHSVVYLGKAETYRDPSF